MLLSGNGRHRRPRPTPKFVLAVGVTGASVALPLIGATGANAASGSAWDKVASCESGNNWSMNTDNGYYGGLQFSETSWSVYGGKQYAPTADLASRNEQIAVAEKILADQGPNAWPECSVQAGLTKADATPDASQSPDVEATNTQPGEGSADQGSADQGSEDTGDTPSKDSSSPKYSQSSESEDSSASEDGTTGQTVSPKDRFSEDRFFGDGDSEDDDSEDGDSEATGSQDTGSTDTGDTTAPEESKAPKHAAPGDGTEAGDEERASRGKHRAPAKADDDQYTVVKGDNLCDIAEDKGLNGGWTALYKANKNTVGQDPDLIVPGQRLEIGTSMAG
ncbi:LysM peptidoglycan-binding domain-containing protein [Wenjunlia tyrosinilytica]|uniref:Peptidoglycan-binding protein LysM n=1 Tax=Wenjunlia tyrosinilytica TaxID=1544741 RepID=A0A917ZPL2_9ACTN|nr:transglycosylase family protein [Wenjunlia tyrosinilytica]GGO88262.1 peptidoglycan-binding protein LysM [Wenjunlia tyrosinilytica]